MLFETYNVNVAELGGSIYGSFNLFGFWVGPERPREPGEPKLRFDMFLSEVDTRR